MNSLQYGETVMIEIGSPLPSQLYRRILQTVFLLCLIYIALPGYISAQYINTNPQPSQFIAGATIPSGSSQIVTFGGGNFLPGVVVKFNGTSVQTDYISANQVVAHIPAGLFWNEGEYRAEIVNPGNASGAGVKLLVYNLQPSINSLQPSSLQRGSGSQLLTVNGDGFMSTTEFTLNGVDIKPFIFAAGSQTSMQFLIPASSLPATPGDYSLVVNNRKTDIKDANGTVTGQYGGGTASQTITITAPPAPQPVITGNASPSSVEASPSGAGYVDVQLSGHFFANDMTVTFNNQAVSVIARPSTDNATIRIPGSLYTQAGSFTIILTNPPSASGGGGSASVGFTVSAPVILPTPQPVITGNASPSSVEASPSGAGYVDVQLYGHFFANDMTVTFNNQAVSVIARPSTDNATIRIPGSLYTQAGPYTIILTNPPSASGGGGSASVGFTVTAPLPAPTPVITGNASPSSVMASPSGSGSIDVQVYGHYFLDNMTATFNGQPVSIVSVVRSSTDYATLRIPGSLYTQAGVVTITITNPPNISGGGGSANVGFSITLPPALVPTIVSDPSPRTIPLSLDGLGFTDITIIGRNFEDNITATFNNQNVDIPSHSSTEVVLHIPASLYRQLGTKPITLTNPSNTSGGGGSTSVAIEVVNPAPNLLSIVPSSLAPGQAAELTLSGENFMPSSKVYVGGVLLQTTFIDNKTLKAVVLATTFPTEGTFAISVRTDEPGGGASSKTITVLILQPTILSCGFTGNNEQLMKEIIPLLYGGSTLEKGWAATQAVQKIKIPVVFHILYNNKNYNLREFGAPIFRANLITYEQLSAALDTLNACFRSIHPNMKLNVPQRFKDAAGADVDIEFAFAQTDPNNQPTQGFDTRLIAPANDPNGLYTFEELDQYITLTTSWNTQFYLNIWIVPSFTYKGVTAGGIASRADQLNPYNIPNDPKSESIMIDFGTLFTDTSPTLTGRFANGSNRNRGKTLVHEVGHWAGLSHLWGEGDCRLTNLGFPWACRHADADFISDTPHQRGPTKSREVYTKNQSTSFDIADVWRATSKLPDGVFDSPLGACPAFSFFPCTTEIPESAGNMYINYMDYADDDFSMMFTKEQMAVMRKVLTIGRPLLISSHMYLPPNQIVPRGPVITSNPTPYSFIANSLSSIDVTFTGYYFYSGSITKVSVDRPPYINGKPIFPGTNLSIVGLSDPIEGSSPQAFRKMTVRVPPAIIEIPGELVFNIQNISETGIVEGSTKVSIYALNPKPKIVAIYNSQKQEITSLKALGNTVQTFYVKGNNLTSENKSTLFVRSIDGIDLPKLNIVEAPQPTGDTDGSFWYKVQTENSVINNLSWPLIAGDFKLVANQEPIYQTDYQGNPVLGKPLGGGEDGVSFTTTINPTATITGILPDTFTLSASNALALAEKSSASLTNLNLPMTTTVTGYNFVEGAQVTVNGSTVATTFMDSTKLTAIIPASYFNQAAALKIDAINPTPGGGSATPENNPIIFKVKNTTPTLSALSTTVTTATVDNRSWAMTISGQNFMQGAKVVYNNALLPASYVKVLSGNSIRAVLPDVPVVSATYSIAVQNPGPVDDTSASLSLNVVYPQPVLHATLPVSPITTTASLSPWMLTLRGGNFSDNAVVSINGQSVPYLYVNSTILKVPMPETTAITAQTYRVVITNPAPGGGSTDTLTVNVVHPTPILDSLSLTRTMAGSPVSVRLVGSRFASGASVLLNGAALTSGVTVESPTSVLVALTGAQIRTAGNYNFSVNNPAPGGGTSSVRTLRVVPAGASTVEFSRVTTAIVAGSRLSNVTLRFRDESGNLTDFDGVLRFSNTSGTSTGTLSLRRSSIGVSTATATRFNLADTYTLSVDSVPAATGKRDFEVVPATDFSVVVTGVPTAQVAGATLPSFTLSYFDRLGNATDDRLGEVRIRHDQKGYLHVLPRTQTDEGVYTTSPIQITTTGSYSVFVTGISVSNITGNRTVSITPAATVSAEFQYVDSNFVAGGKQTAFRVTYRDSFGNSAEGPTTVLASGTTEQGTSTASITLIKSATSLYYTAESTAFSVPGAYNLAVVGISQYSGQRAFTVTGLSAYYASVSTLPQIATAGAQLSAFTIRLTDRLSNPITGNIGTVALRHSRGYYHALSAQAQANGQYSISGMQLTTIGTYTISIGGIATENITGNRIITVEQAPVASAAFQYVDSSFNAGGKQVAFRVTYRDAFGNLLDGPESVTAVSGSSTSTIALTKISLGVYTAAITTFTVPGAYTLSVAGISQYIGQRTFTVNSIAASNALVVGVSPTLTAGTQLGTFTIRLTDSQNNPVSGNIGAVTLRHERGFTHTLLAQAQADGVYSVQGVPVTTVGTYTVNIAGIAAANITGNRSVLVAPASVASAAFQYVDTSITAGGKQVAFRVTYRDGYGNLVEGPTTVTASNGSSTASNGSSTASITLTSISNGVYTAVSTPFTIAGNYTLTIAGVTSEGTRTFTVLPSGVATVEIRGVQASINKDAQQSGITLAIADRFGNATDRASVLRFTRTTTNPASTGTITLTRTALGTMSAEATAFSVVGAYRLSVDGIAASALLGTTTFTVTTAATKASSFKGIEAQLTAAQHNTETSVGASEEVVAGVMPLSVATYPNPAVSEMELVVRLPREERVSITLRDNLGRVVAIVAEATMRAGENRLQYNLSTIPSGAYSCMVQSLSGTAAARVMVVR